MSVVSRVELEGGVYRDADLVNVRRARLAALLLSIPALNFDEAEADAYRAIVEWAGYSQRKLRDRMIAAQALVHRATLATQNGADFRDVPGLPLLER
jgi:predicted nucleic acid-binding protein